MPFPLGRFQYLTVVGDAVAGAFRGKFYDFTSRQQLNAGGTLTNGYAQITANQAGITVVVDVTGLTVTVAVGAGRRIRISTNLAAQNGTADQGCHFFIKEGATALVDGITLNGNANVASTCNPSVVLTPSAGSHTYKVTAQNYVGGTVQVNASATAPLYILAEDIGV